MKKIICLFIVAVMVLSTALFTGCGKDNKKESETKSESTKAAKVDSNSEIQKYLNKFLEGDSDFYGAWQMEGFDYMTILFRNDNMAEMVSGGTEGYFSKYTLKNEEKTVTVQLMPNVIDGEYKYEFSKDKKKMTLTLNSSKLVFNRQKDFSLLPEAPKNPKIDKDIIGWWENDDGLFYCFQSNGIMYENSISMETCYTYSVENGKIKAKYSSGGEMDEEFTYSYKNGKLTLNGSECKKKDME